MKMNQHPKVVFVCEHGAAKSIIAAAYFNKLADEDNLGLTAIARGTHPDAELSSKTIAGLREEGLTPTESIPTRLDRTDLEYAHHIVSFCRLPEEYSPHVKVEYWDDVPAVSENYERARDAILARLKELINHR
jgi:protein-tyrosine-phosphatase